MADENETEVDQSFYNFDEMLKRLLDKRRK